MTETASKPLVSVCMITYNHEAYIREAIEGVIMQQTDFPFELVIGEDCSNDNTKKICIDYQSRYPNIIKLISNKNNIGMIENFINTIKNCTGEYIAICDGDDFWVDSAKLQKQINFLNTNTNYTIVVSNSLLLDSNSKSSYASNIASGDFTIEQMIEKNLIGEAASTIVFTKKCISPYFAHNIINAPFGDWALSLLCLSKGKGYIMSDITSCYRKHTGGNWSSTNTIHKIVTTIHMYDYMLNLFPNHRIKIIAYRDDFIINSIKKIHSINSKKTKVNLVKSLLIKLNKIINNI